MTSSSPFEHSATSSDGHREPKHRNDSTELTDCRPERHLREIAAPNGTGETRVVYDVPW